MPRRIHLVFRRQLRAFRQRAVKDRRIGLGQHQAAAGVGAVKAAAGEIVDPAVVGTLEGPRVAAPVGDLDPSVDTHVVVGGELPRRGARDDDGLARDAHRQVVARIR